MVKVVLNKCYGGYGLSPKAIKQILRLKGYTDITETSSNGYCFTISAKRAGNTEYFNSSSFSDTEDRIDPIVVKVVEDLKEEANGEFANLQIEELNLDWYISDYDGIETVHLS